MLFLRYHFGRVCFDNTHAIPAHSPQSETKMPRIPVAPLVLVLAASTSFSAQDVTWTGAAFPDTRWGVDANWSPAAIPLTEQQIAILGLSDSYTVRMESVNPSLSGLFITNPLASLHVLPGRTLGVGIDGIHNNGQILINPDNTVSSTSIVFSESASLSGTGAIVLNGNLSRARLATTNGAVITQDHEHSIRGFGFINVGMFNSGSIRATSSNQELIIFNSNITNQGLVGSVDDGRLVIQSCSILQEGDGGIVSDGGLITIRSASVDGGSLSNTNADPSRFRVDREHDIQQCFRTRKLGAERQQHAEYRWGSFPVRRTTDHRHPEHADDDQTQLPERCRPRWSRRDRPPWRR